MPIDAAEAVAAEPRSTEIRWTAKDVQLYHLGIGAGADPDRDSPATDPGELRYLLESRLRVLPSFATVAGAGVPGVIGALSMPGVDVDLAKVLHGGQSLEIHRPVPAEGSAVATDRITAVYDKGSAAVLVMRTEVADAEGPLWTGEATVFVRGAGGWGGDRGPSAPTAPPTREPHLTVGSGATVGSHVAVESRATVGSQAAVEPHVVVERPTRPDQALLYRLSGDPNPLHADPEFARSAGFDRPVLHGLCTYGITLKAVVDTLLDGDVGRVRGYATRFAGVVYPGETLRVRMWREEGWVRVAVGAVERGDTPVLTDTVVRCS